MQYCESKWHKASSYKSEPVEFAVDVAENRVISRYDLCMSCTLHTRKLLGANAIFRIDTRPYTRRSHG